MMMYDEQWCGELSTDALLDLLDDDPTFPEAELLADQRSSCFGLADEEPATGLCWGGLMSGSPEGCTPGFVPKSSHFKSKLCPQCKHNGITVPMSRIKPLLREHAVQNAAVANAHSSGLWSRMGDGQEARMVNHTAKCSGPSLLIYRHPRPPEERATWPTLPDGWVEPGALSMRLALALGTLRPMAAMNRARAALNGPASNAVGMPGAAAPHLAMASSATGAVGGSEGAVGEGEGARTTAATQAIEPAPKRVRVLTAGGALGVASDGTMEAATCSLPSGEELAAVAAAVNNEAFQRDFDDRLRVCAAGFGALGAPGRALSHRMFCDSTRRALASAVGDDVVSRVLGVAALVQSGGGGGGGCNGGGRGRVARAES